MIFVPSADSDTGEPCFVNIQAKKINFNEHNFLLLCTYLAPKGQVSCRQKYYWLL